MSPILITALAALGAATMFGLLISWAKVYATDLKAASGHVDSAYDAAQTLVKDPRTSEPVLRFVEFFSSRVGTPVLARRFALHLLTGGLAKADISPTARKFQAELAALDDGQKEAFANLIASGMVSSAASDPVFSRFYLMAVHTFMSAAENEANLRNKVSRGGFSAAFFLQAMKAMGCQTIRIADD